MSGEKMTKKLPKTILMWDKFGRKLTKVLIIEEVSENLINSSNAKTENAKIKSITKQDKQVRLMIT